MAFEGTSYRTGGCHTENDDDQANLEDKPLLSSLCLGAVGGWCCSADWVSPYASTTAKQAKHMSGKAQHKYVEEAYKSSWSREHPHRRTHKWPTCCRQLIFVQIRFRCGGKRRQLPMLSGWLEEVGFVCLWTKWCYTFELPTARQVYEGMSIVLVASSLFLQNQVQFYITKQIELCKSVVSLS